MTTTVNESAAPLKREFANANGGEPIELDAIKIMVELDVNENVVKSYGEEAYRAYRALKAA